MGNLEARDIAVWLGLGQTLWLLGLSIAVWLRKPGNDAQQSIKGLHEQMAAQTLALTSTMNQQHHSLDLRLKAVETDLKHMPTTKEMQRVDAAVGVVAEQTRSMAVSIDGLRGQLARIETFLLNQKGP